jgi:hypothetical protein
MSDLVKRLYKTPLYYGNGEASALGEEAADEIARLTAEVEKLTTALAHADEQAKKIEAALWPTAELNARLTAEVESLRALAATCNCGGMDDGNHFSDCPYLLSLESPRRAIENAALTARVAELEAILQAWDNAVRIDVLMEGPRYMGVDLRRGRDAWEKTSAALSPAQKGEE